MRHGHPALLAIADRLDDRAFDSEISRPVAEGVITHVRSLAVLVADGDEALDAALFEAQSLALVASTVQPRVPRPWAPSREAFA